MPSDNGYALAGVAAGVERHRHPDGRGDAVSEYNVTPTKHGVKLMLNGFPKSGLHLLGLMVTPFVGSIQDEMVQTMWSGINGAWALEPLDLNDRLFKISRLGDGEFVFSHSVYNKKLADFLWYSGIGLVFIYRDFRDVAVSQTYHILADDDTYVHNGKDKYRELGGFDEVLAAVITGYDKYPGVMERWERYRPWLFVPWVLSLSFEQLRLDPLGSAKRVFNYALNRMPMQFHKRVEVEPDTLDRMARKMVEHGNMTEYSSTFRKGKVGGWRDEFTLRHKKLFIQSDKHYRLAEMGYE